MSTKIKNSFFAKLSRARSKKTVESLEEILKENVSNPKTIRRRRRALEEKLAKFAA